MWWLRLPGKRYSLSVILRSPRSGRLEGCTATMLQCPGRRPSRLAFHASHLRMTEEIQSSPHDRPQSRPGRCLPRQAQSGAAGGAGVWRRLRPGARARRSADPQRGRRHQRSVLAGADGRRPDRVGAVAASRGGEHHPAVRRQARGVGEGRRPQCRARGRDAARRRAEGMPRGDRGRRAAQERAPARGVRKGEERRA
jgi:hypothetical protein